MSRRTIAIAAVLTLTTPALADFVTIDNGGGLKTTYEIKSRRGDVVVVQEEAYLGNPDPASSTWTINCAKRTMIATYKDGIRNSWFSDGKRWWATSFAINAHKTRGYDEYVGRFYEYGCNGVIPEDPYSIKTDR